MKIEKYHYSERKKEQEARKKQREKHQNFSLCFQADEVANVIRPMLEEQLSELFPCEEEVISVLNPHKVQNFKQYAEQAILLAEKHELNLLIDTDRDTGSIAFVGEFMNFCDNQLAQLCQLMQNADEMYLKQSCDTGNGSPTDVDGCVQLELWFGWMEII